MIKRLFGFLKQVTVGSFRFVFRNLGPLMLGALCLGSGSFLALAIITSVQDQNRVHELVMFADVQGVPQILGALRVTHVSHQPDGSICFTDFGQDSHRCVKVQMYRLLEINVK